MMRWCHDDDTFTNFKCDGHVLIEFAFELVDVNDANNTGTNKLMQQTFTISNH